MVRQRLHGPACLTAVMALGAMAANAPAAGQTAPLWGTLTPGPHDVGFERVWELDASRVWPRAVALDSTAGEVARPIRVDLWYPGDCAGHRRMPLQRYLAASPPDPYFQDLVFLTRRWDEYSYRGLAGDSAAFDRLMAVPTAACAGAPAAAGRFPLVVYSAGWFNRAPDNTVLAEYLASHGFVVAAVPQLNPGLWTFSFASDAPSVENQVRDLEVTIGLLADDPRVDRTRVAAMGYSTGGDVALLLAGRNPLVDAVVGLDASWSLGRGNDVATSSLFVPTAHSAPAVALRRPVTEPAADSVAYRLSAAHRLLVTVPDADHGTFSDDPPQRLLLGSGGTAAAARHDLMATAVHRVMRGLLRANGAADVEGLARALSELGLAVRVLPAETDDAGS